MSGGSALPGCRRDVRKYDGITLAYARDFGINVQDEAIRCIWENDCDAAERRHDDLEDAEYHAKELRKAFASALRAFQAEAAKVAREHEHVALSPEARANGLRCACGDNIALAIGAL